MSHKGRVVFVRPPNLQKSGAWKKQGVIRCPLNLALLASYARKLGGFDCALVDFEVKEVHSTRQMAEMVLAENPSYILVTTLTPRYPATVRMLQEIKKLSPRVQTIVGGPHVTGAPAHCLFDGIDYGILGEGEEALLELLQTLEKGQDPTFIRNLVYRRDGRTAWNLQRPFIKNLDALPFPAWDLMDFKHYADPAYFEGSHLAVYTSRGCPYDCEFCASAVTWQRKLRLRSVDNVLDEIRVIVKDLGIGNIMFWDDCFAADEKRAREICRRLIDETLDVRYTVQVRADSVTEEMADLLKRSGCLFAAIGVESGNEAILKRIGKREAKGDFSRAIATLKKAGLPSIASYILGLPGDTHETIRETIDFAFELDADQSKFMVLAPFPGTRVYDLALERSLVDPTDFAQMEATNYYDSVSINLSNVSDEDLLRYQDEAYQKFDDLQKERNESTKHRA